MSAPTDPTAAQAGRVANQSAVLQWLEALSTGNCDQSTFLGRVDELLRGSEDAAWEVLALLDQYYRRGKIEATQFHALKSHVQRLALGAHRDFDGARSPSKSEPMRARSVTVPVGASMTRNSVVTAIPPPAPTAAKEPAAVADARAVPVRAPRQQREPMPSVGDVLRGRYRIVSVLGQGGMGTVFEAVDLDRVDLPETSQRLAIKVLHTEVTQRPQLFVELRREFQHLQALSHPNIVRVHEFDRDGDTAFFTMELLLGSSLGQLLAKREGGTLDRPQALGVIRDVGAALAHAHSRGVVHGDINPQNIFITLDGDVRVLDFGASHKLKRGPWIAEFESRMPLAVATPGYASCQVLEGEVAEVRDDVFGFACITYLLLTGTHPFERRTALEARDMHLKPRRPAGLSGSQWRVMQEGLCFERERRPADVRDWLARLRLEAPAQSLGLFGAGNARRKWTIAAACGVAAAALVLGGLWLKGNGDLQRENAVAPSITAQLPRDTAGPAVAASEGPPASMPFPTEPQSAAPPATVPKSAPAIPATAPPAAPTGTSPAAPSSEPGSLAAAAPTASAAASPLASPTGPPTPPPEAAPTAAAAPAAGAPAAPIPATHARVELAAAVVDVPPTEASALVPVSRKGGMRGEASFRWWTESGTAKAGADFAPVAAHIEHIADRKGTIKLMIPLVSDPTRHEPKSFYVLIDEVDPGTAIVGRTTTMVTIAASQ